MKCKTTRRVNAVSSRRDSKKDKTSEKEYDSDRKQQDSKKFVGDYFDIDVLCGTEITLPPVPIVDSGSMFDVAKRINEFAKTITPRTKPCADIFYFKRALNNDRALFGNYK